MTPRFLPVIPVLTTVQWVFGALLLAGCALIISIRDKGRAAPENMPKTPPQEVQTL